MTPEEVRELIKEVQANDEDILGDFLGSILVTCVDFCIRGNKTKEDAQGMLTGIAGAIGVTLQENDETLQNVIERCWNDRRQMEQGNDNPDT